LSIDKNTVTTLGLYNLSVLSLIDKGKHESLETLNDLLENKRVFDYLEKEYGDIQPFDFKDREMVHDLLFDMYSVLEGREQRKMWVSDNGLCVLAAYLNTLMMD